MKHEWIFKHRAKFFFRTAIIRAGALCFAVSAMCLGADLPKLPIGMNLPSNNYYSTCRVFTDVMKTASEWISFDTAAQLGWDTQVATQIPKDSNGYPQKLPYTVAGVPQAVRFLINNFYTGEYAFLYDGDGDFAFFTKGHELRNGRHYIRCDGQGGNSWIQIMRSAPANHVRNIRIVPVAYENSATYPTFDSLFVKGLKPFHALRLMDWVGTNNSTQAVWTDRLIPTFYSQGTDKGMSWEYAIELCNMLHADPWVCVPHKADDNYHHQLAQLFKDKLNPTLKIYLEYSNEIWNWIFGQSQWYTKNAPGGEQYVQNDLAAIGQKYCNDPAGYCHPQKGGYMMARTFRLFRDIFSGADKSRIIRVAGVQHAWYGNTQTILSYLFDDNKQGCDAVSPAGYINFQQVDHQKWNAMNPAAVTPEMVNAAVDAGYDSTSGLWTRETAKFATQYGVDFFVYEGGQHMQPWMQGDYAYNHAVWDAQINPGMYDLYMKNFRCHTEPAVNCKLFMAFSYVGERESRWGSWGHLESVDQLKDLSNIKAVAPKYAALLDANTPKDATIARPAPVVSRQAMGPKISNRILCNVSSHAPRTLGQSFAAKSLVEVYNLNGSRILSGSSESVKGAMRTQPRSGIFIIRETRTH